MVELFGFGGDFLVGHGQNPQTFAGEIFGHVAHFFPGTTGTGGANVKKFFRGPFDENPFFLALSVQGGHIASFRLERNNVNLGVVVPLHLGIEAGLQGRDDQGGFGRVPVHPVDPLFLIEVGFVAQKTDAEDPFQFGVEAGIDRQPFG